VAANKLIYAMLSDKGRVRRANEDACGASSITGAFVVCDGMGGAAGGEIASHLAAETFLAQLAPTEEKNHKLRRASDRLNSAIQAANQAVYQQSRHSPQLTGMGTTLVGMLHTPLLNGRAGKRPTPSVRTSEPPTLWLAHVGDSRGYLRRGGKLLQLTADHSLVEEQLRAGQITAEQAARSPMRNLITRAIGSQATVEPEIHGYNPLPGDLYLLTSDGLNRELADEEIERILTGVPDDATEGILNRACRDLVREANVRGGRDNITVMLISVQRGSASES
jgi:protein phosphatase